jgi:hypothetical protein
VLAVGKAEPLKGERRWWAGLAFTRHHRRFLYHS